MEKKTDLRITKTYMALTNAFLQMMEEFRFEDITVKELCNRAMIRKSTFYKHFADKYELLAFIVQEIQAKFDMKTAKEIKTENRAEFYTALVSNILDFLAENERLVHSTMKSRSFPIIMNLLSEQIISDIRMKLKEDERNGYKMPASPEIMAPFFVGAIMETIRTWINKGKPIAEKNLKEQLNSILKSIYNSENEEN